MKGWPLALLVVLPSPALAQEGAMLPLGVRVRVSTSDRASVLTLRGPEVVAAGWRDDRIVGTLARLRDDTLVVVPDGHDLSLAIPYATLGELEVSRGRHRRTGRGALIGLGTGVAGGVVAALVLCHDDRCESSGGDFAGFADAGNRHRALDDADVEATAG